MADDDQVQVFDWADFLELARELVERDDEASQRTAISRSYYAVFHLAKRVLERLDPEYSAHRSRDSHQQVWQRFRQISRRQARNAERRGRTLLAERRKADYERGGEGWSKRARDAVTHAEGAITGLADLLSED